MNDQAKLLWYFSLLYRFGFWYPLRVLLFWPLDLFRLLRGQSLVWPRLLQILGSLLTVGDIFWLWHNGARTQDQFFPAFFPLAGTVVLHRMALHGESPFGRLLAGRIGFSRQAHRTIDGEAVVRGAWVKRKRQGRHAATSIRFGGETIAHGSECQHFLLSGRTGAGKSQAIYSLLSAVVARSEPVFLADPGAGYLARYGKPGDLVLNPLDPRDTGWNPFLEIEHDYDCDRLAKAAIPDADGESRQWHFYAQTLLASVLLRMYQTGQSSVAELLRLLTSSTASELAMVAAGTAAESMTAKGADRMLGSTRAILSTYLAAWRYLPEHGTFSIRRWMRSAAAGNAPWLFATYRDDQMALLRLLIACWLDLAIVELLSQPEKPERRVWFIVDEMDSLGKVGAMRDGLTKLRKYGGSVVAGLQTIAQLRSTYGRDEAQVLLSCLATKLILAAGDAETAKYFEEQIGQQEVERRSSSWGRSSSSSGNSTSSNIQQQRHLQAAVLASEITSLPDLQGFLQVPSGGLSRVTLTYQAQKQ